MADKIVVLDKGTVAQVGSPLELYNRPNGSVRRRLHRLADDEFRQGPAGRQARRGDHRHPARASRAVDERRANGRRSVRLAEHLGSDTFIYADADGLGQITVRVDGEAPTHSGDTDLSSRRARIAFTGSTRKAAGSVERKPRDRACVAAILNRPWTSIHERQTLRRRPRQPARRVSSFRTTGASRSQRRASSISAWAIFTAPIRPSISTISSAPGAIATGRSSARAFATPTRSCAKSSPRRTG